MSVETILALIEHEAEAEVDRLLAAARADADARVRAAETAAERRSPKPAPGPNRGSHPMPIGGSTPPASGSWSDGRPSPRHGSMRRSRWRPAGWRRSPTAAIRSAGSRRSIASPARRSPSPARMPSWRFAHGTRPGSTASVAALGARLVPIPDDEPAGVVVRSDDRRLEIDATLAVRLARARTAQTEPVAAALGLERAAEGGP